MAARRGQAGRRLALAASALAHVVFFAVLAWHLGRATLPAETPAMTVALVDLPPRAHREPPPPPPRAPPPAPLPSKRPPVLSAPAETPTPVAPVPPAEPDARGDGVRQALRGRLGCANAGFLGLTREERERCVTQLAAETPPRAGATQGSLDLSKGGRYAPDNPEAYLARRPTHGCKPRTSGDQAPSGQQGAAVGIACAWRF